MTVSEEAAGRPSRWMERAGWVSLAAVAVLATGGAASRPGGALLGAPRLLPLAACLAVVLALRILAGPSAARPLAPLALLAAGTLLLLPWPGLRALSGPPLLAVAAGGAVLVLATLRRAPPAWLFLPVVLSLYSVVAARTQRQVGPEGDEPHYLMVADSLLRDGDLNLEEDYAAGRYAAFHPRPLEPHYRVRGAHGEIYSVHSIGLSLLVLPAYAAAGYAGASFFMALLAAFLAREIRELARDWLGDDRAAEGCGWLVALSPPLVHYAGLVFTEVPAALVAAVALRHGGRRASWARTAGVACAIAYLPWLHVRYVALAAVLLAYLLFARPRRRPFAFIGAAAASAVALAAYHHQLYGFFDPRRVWGRRPELDLALLPNGLQGLLLDQEFGLLPYAPLFVLFIFPGLAVLWRRSRGGAMAVLAVVAATLLIAAAWPMWRGGFNPPARFLVPALPALALGVAAALRRGMSAPAALLAGWSLWTGLAGGWQPRLVHRDRDGTAPLFRTVAGAEEWTRLLPGYVLEESAGDRAALAIVWGAALAAAAFGARKGGVRFGRALAGLVAATAAASLASTARTGGRDAVRVIGRPAVEVPWWRVQRAAVAAWGPEALSWGPLFEAHRHPQGAEIGARLPLPAGRYRVRLDAQVPGSVAPAIVRIHPEGREAGGPREAALEMTPGGLEGSFEVLPGESAVTLRLAGGPLLLRRIELAAQPWDGETGPIGSGGQAAGVPRHVP